MVRKSLNQAKILLWITAGSMMLSSVSLGIIPWLVSNDPSSGERGVYIVSTILWLGIISAIVVSFITRSTLYKYKEKLIRKKALKRQMLPGIISVSRNKSSLILYCIIVTGVVIIITDCFFNYVNQYILFPILSVTVLSFMLHCIIDGKYYKVYKLIKEKIKNDTMRKD